MFYKIVMLPSKEQLTTILIGRNYLISYIGQSNYCIIEIFKPLFSKE